MKKFKLYSFMSIIVMAAIIVIISCKKDDDSDIGPQKYSIGGTVEGLLGSGLVLQNNNNDDLAISENGAFTFPVKVEDSSLYDVTIETYPVEQTCWVEDGSGMVEGDNVTNVRVICETPDIVGDCSNGSIDYYHEIDIDYEGFFQAITVFGTVPFTCDEQGNLSGSGTVSISVVGVITGPCLHTDYSGDATMNVILTGTYSVAQVAVDLHETWYVGSPMASGTAYDTCEDESDPFSYPLLENVVVQPLVFPTIDGYTYTTDFMGAGGSGFYSWTLHII